MRVEFYSAFSKLRLSVMDEDNKKRERERELNLVQGASARVLRAEQGAIVIQLPAKEDFRRTGFDSPLSG
jgi:hypothetical protein